MMRPLPYCGAAPHPADILERFNLDPILLITLGLLCIFHVIALLRKPSSDNRRRWVIGALGGWFVATVALVSPLCALSVALFSARVTQHMILILVAGPLIAISWPRTQPTCASRSLWVSAAAFFIALWFWHMPVPYEATFRSVAVYWSMHLTLFGSSILLWRELINHSAQRTPQALAAGMVTFMHMGLLGAILTFADRPMFPWHLVTTQAWGLTPLQDQQLGGTVMWVPGIALFMWTSIRSLGRLWQSMEQTPPV